MKDYDYALKKKRKNSSFRLLIFLIIAVILMCIVLWFGFNSEAGFVNVINDTEEFFTDMWKEICYKTSNFFYFLTQA